jgi:hypothetical protein
MLTEIQTTFTIWGINVEISDKHNLFVQYLKNEVTPSSQYEVLSTGFPCEITLLVLQYVRNHCGSTVWIAGDLHVWYRRKTKFWYAIPSSYCRNQEKQKVRY